MVNGEITMNESHKIVFSALSLIEQAEIGNTGLVIENSGVSKVTDKDGHIIILMNIYVKTYKNVMKASIPRIIRRWVSAKISSITSDTFEISCEYNEDDKIYEVSIKFN